MIKINLPENFSELKAVNDVYNKITEKVWKTLRAYPRISIYFCDEKQESSKETIKRFLISENFHSYEFKGESKENIHAIFNYNKMTDVQRHTILTNMGLNVCPYCNMNYTLSYSLTKGKRRTTADLDHFYVKNKNEFPAYGLCLYNGIPSCPVCNSRFKGQKGMTRESHIFPHEEGWGSDVRFEIENLLDCVLGSAVPRITLEEYGSNQDKINRAKTSAELFRIKERYEAHHDFVSDILEKAVIYSESYQEELNSFFEGGESPLLVKYAVFGSPLSDDDCLNTSLGKLKKDLLEQLEVY